jgi:hypothetical protein
MSHLVHEQRVQVQAQGSADPFLLLREVSRVFREQAPGHLGLALDELLPGSAHHQFERLELDLGVLREDELERNLRHRIADALRKALAPVPGRKLAPGERARPGEMAVLSPAVADEALLREFLETGTLPWWAGRLKGTDLESRLVAMLGRYGDQVPDWLRWPDEPERIARRLLGQLSPATVLKVRQALGPDSSTSNVMALLTEASALPRYQEAGQGPGASARGEAPDEVLLRIFLLTGQALSWAGHLSSDELEARLLAVLGRRGSRALEWLQGHDEARLIARRVLEHFSPATVMKLLRALAPDVAAAQALAALLEGSPPGVDAAVWQASVVRVLLPVVLSWPPRQGWPQDAIALLHRAVETLRKVVEHLPAPPEPPAPSIPYALSALSGEAVREQPLSTRVGPGDVDKVDSFVNVENGENARSLATSDEVLLQVYLDTGGVPSWAGRLSGAGLEARLLAILDGAGGRAPRWFQGRADAERVARRVLRQFSPATVVKLLRGLAPDAAAARALEALLRLDVEEWQTAVARALLPLVMSWPPGTGWTPVADEAPAGAQATSARAGSGEERTPSPATSDEALLRALLTTGVAPPWAGPLSDSELEARVDAMLQSLKGHAPGWLRGPEDSGRIAWRVLTRLPQAAGMKLLRALAPDAAAAETLEALLQGPPPGLDASGWQASVAVALLPVLLTWPARKSWPPEATALLHRVCEAVRDVVEQLSAPPAEPAAEEVKDTSDEAVLRAFLERGIVPPWAGPVSGADLEARLLAMLEREGRGALDWLRGHADAERIALRVLGQFSPAAAVKLLYALAPDVAAAVTLAVLVEGNPTGADTSVWQAAVVRTLLPLVMSWPPGQGWPKEAIPLFQQACEAVRKVVEQTPAPPATPPPVAKLAQDASDEGVLRAFLETGEGPSGAGPLSGAELEARLLAMLERGGGHAAPTWLQGRDDAELVGRRLLEHLSPGAALKLLRGLAPDAVAAGTLAALLAGSPPGVDAAAWRATAVGALLPVVLRWPPGQSWPPGADALLHQAIRAAGGTVEQAEPVEPVESVKPVEPAPHTPAAAVEVLSPEASNEALVRVYLETGKVPAGRLSGVELEARLVAMLDWGGGRPPKWLQGHKDGERIGRQLLEQLSPAAALKLLRSLALSEEATRTVRVLLEASPAGVSPDAWRSTVVEAFLPLLLTWSPVEESPAPSRPAVYVPSSSDASEQLLEHGLPVDNAGLVILHPFLKTFFGAVGLLEGKGFRDLAAQCRAVCLLQWLVHGDGADAEDEHRMALAKLLCGVPLEEVVPRIGGPSEVERAEGEELLRQVVARWTVIKNTSVRGLRESFLQRDGMLQSEETGWVLQIQAKPYDMLLERLPWGVSHVRLSWMAGLLRVER